MQITLAFNHFGRGLVQRLPRWGNMGPTHHPYWANHSHGWDFWSFSYLFIRCRFGFCHVVNNHYSRWLMYAVGGSAHPTILSQGNRFNAPNLRFSKEVGPFYTYTTYIKQWSPWMMRMGSHHYLIDQTHNIRGYDHFMIWLINWSGPS